jgi:hypothetical protein
MIRLIGLVLLLGFPWIAGCAQQRAAEDYAHPRFDYARLAARLETGQSADSLATAAMLKRFGSEADSGAYPLIDQAVQKAPERSDLAWLAVRLCISAPDCDLPAREAHLRSLAPANSASYLGSLNRAQAANDAAGVDAALRSMGDAEHFDVYFNSLVALGSRELAGAAQSGGTKPNRQELANATMTVVGIAAASLLPGFQAMSFACKGEALELSDRRELCRRAAQTLESGDTYIVEGLGLSMQQRLWPADSPQARSIKERQRVVQYRLEEYSRLPVSSANAAELPADFLDVLSANRREQDASLVYFRRAGVPVDPPTGWVSSMPPRFQ